MTCYCCLKRQANKIIAGAPVCDHCCYVAYWTHWAIISGTFCICGMLGYALAGWIGAVICGLLYLLREGVVVFFAWRSRP